jgi:hypothetical protein
MSPSRFPALKIEDRHKKLYTSEASCVTIGASQGRVIRRTARAPDESDSTPATQSARFCPPTSGDLRNPPSPRTRRAGFERPWEHVVHRILLPLSTCGVI